MVGVGHSFVRDRWLLLPAPCLCQHQAGLGKETWLNCTFWKDWSLVSAPPPAAAPCIYAWAGLVASGGTSFVFCLDGIVGCRESVPGRWGHLGTGRAGRAEESQCVCVYWGVGRDLRGWPCTDLEQSSSRSLGGGGRAAAVPAPQERRKPPCLSGNAGPGACSAKSPPSPVPVRDLTGAQWKDGIR